MQPKKIFAKKTETPESKSAAWCNRLTVKVLTLHVPGYPKWTLVHIPAVLLPIQLPASNLGK